MYDDANVTDVLNRAVATLEPRTDVLVSGGVARGRQLRRRRRIAQGASGAALAGLITTVAVAVWPSAVPAGHPNVAGHHAVAGNSPAAVGPAQVADDTVTITPQVLLKTALGLLPGNGHTTRYTGRAFPGWVGAEFVYEDGDGAAAVDVAMGFVQDGVHGAQAPCTPGDPNATGTCTVLADGSHLFVFRGPEYAQGHQPYNATQWAVDLVRADGVEVSVAEWNSAQEKDSATTRQDPPFTIAELTAIAASPKWTVEVSKSGADAVAGSFTPDRTDETKEPANAQSDADKAKAKALKSGGKAARAAEARLRSKQQKTGH